MNEPAKIEFSVDEQYENEKGVFKVVSIHRNQMVIRWENGEEIRTDVELQRRILERRQWEELNQEMEAQSGSKASSRSGRPKSAFTGFSATDFKKSASGTTWRSRNQLGEKIIQKIDTIQFKFNSWAFGNKPEMHVQDVKRRGLGATDYQARFFVRVDQQALYYGFRVARPDSRGVTLSDWDAFTRWLTEQENEQIVRKIARENKLAVCNHIKPTSKPMVAGDDGWRKDESAEKPDTASLTDFINESAESDPFDLELTVTINKIDAVACGDEIAPNIAKLFTQLLPLYHAAVIH